MPPIYYLNPPPNPFWDFVAGLEDHPLWRGQPGTSGPPNWPGARPGPPPRPTSTQDTTAQPQPQMSEKAQGKQAYVEDPPEVDPSTIKPEASKAEDTGRERIFPFRGRGRFAGVFEEDKKDRAECRKERAERRAEHCAEHRAEKQQERAERQQDRAERRCRGGPGRGRFGPYGPPPFMSGHPFFGRPPWAQPEFQGPPHHGPDHPHPHPHHHPHGPPPHARGPHRRPSPPHQRGSFDLAEFLNKLGSKLGIDLSNATEGLGLAQDRFAAGRTSADVNFEPRADIFENKDFYTVHLSLPGAKKEDVGVEYEGDHSVLRITGVVHRPDVDEQMMGELVVDGRKRETGVFEKAIRLGTKREPANIDVAGIHAKMTDGVLVVRIPKTEKKEYKREVSIATEDAAPAPAQPDYDNDYSEKPILFDADDQVSVVASDAAGPATKREEISLIDMKDSRDDSHPVEEKEQSAKAAEAEKAKQSTTADEQLPAYSVEASNREEDDWERFSDDSGEGEYIKIDVK